MTAANEVTDDREAMHRARSLRYAEAITTAAAADDKIKALTEQLAESEYIRRTAEDAAALVNYLDNYDRHVYTVGDPEPAFDVEYVISLSSGAVFQSVRWNKEEERRGWHRIDFGSNSIDDWSTLQENSPFIAMTECESAYGIDHIAKRMREHIETERELGRRLPSENHRQSLPDRVDYLKRLRVDDVHKLDRQLALVGERARHIKFLADRMADALRSGDGEQRRIALEAWIERTVDGQ